MNLKINDEITIVLDTILINSVIIQCQNFSMSKHLM